MSNSEKINELETAIVAGAISALDRRAGALHAKADLGITVVASEHGPATIISSEAAAALRLAGDFEEIAGDLRNGGRA
jgi:hypothetical protein